MCMYKKHLDPLHSPGPQRQRQECAEGGTACTHVCLSDTQPPAARFRSHRQARRRWSVVFDQVDLSDFDSIDSASPSSESAPKQHHTTGTCSAVRALVTGRGTAALERQCNRVRGNRGPPRIQTFHSRNTGIYTEVYRAQSVTQAALGRHDYKSEVGSRLAPDESRVGEVYGARTRVPA